MDGSPEAVPTTDGYLVVDEDGVRIEADLDQFLAGQAAVWNGGDAADRLLLLYRYLLSLVLFLIAAVVYGRGIASGFLTAVFVLAGVGVLAWSVRLSDVGIDHDAVETVDLDLGERAVHLKYTDHRTTRWATPEKSTYFTTLRFPSDEAARRARTALSESPLADRLDVTEADAAVETEHRVDVEDGVLFCESCGTQVSPTDRRCPTCDYGLRPDTTAEPPPGTAETEADPETVETDHRVDVEDGVLFCESCGSQVSPTDRRCPSCDYRIWAERDAPDPDADAFSVDDPERETETIYRVDTEKGVPFCENCGAKVSPTDDACRSCDYVLRVERVVVTDDEA